MQALDGPAEGISLSLRCCPTYLRLVVDSVTGKWDALDQPNDEPSETEECFPYMIVPGTFVRSHVLIRGKNRDGSGWWEFGEYKHLSDISPVDIRTRPAWKQAIAGHLGISVEEIEERPR